MSREKVKAGDLVHRTARFVLSDLTRTLEGLHRLTEDSRTTAFRDLLNRSKVLLLQLLAVSRWIGASGTSAVFRQVEAMERRMADRELALNSDLDRLFYLHAALYMMRSHGYYVATAGEIMASRGYELLPSSLFLEEAPRADARRREDLLKSMNTFLQSKVLLHDCLPVGIEDLTIDNGCLRLTQRGLYLLRLTLDSLSESASWRLVEFRLEVTNHNIECLGLENSTYKTDTVEQRVTTTLKTMLSRKADMNLSSICTICRAASLAVAHRVLLAQANELSKTEEAGKLTVSFSAVGDASILDCEFWPSSLPSPHHFKLKIVHSSSNLAELMLMLTLEDDEGSLEIDSFPLGGSCLGWRGVSFRSVLELSLCHCVQKRLESLHCRLLDGAKHGLVIELESFTLSLTVGCARYRISIDISHGNIVKSDFGRAYDTDWFEEFFAELNDLQAFHAFKMTLRVGTAQAPQISTLPILCRFLHLEHWFHQIQSYSGMDLEILNSYKRKRLRVITGVSNEFLAAKVTFPEINSIIMLIADENNLISVRVVSDILPYSATSIDFEDLGVLILHHGAYSQDSEIPHTLTIDSLLSAVKLAKERRLNSS